MPKRPAEDLEEGELDEVENPVVESPLDGQHEDLMQYAILPITKMQGDVPMTGEEYLYMVREERNRLPKVATVKVYGTNRMALSDLLPVSEHTESISLSLKPEEEWQKQVLSVFENDRSTWAAQLEALEESGHAETVEFPAINDEISWNKYLYGADPEVEPSFEIFAELGHVAKMRLILYHHRWLDASNAISSGQYKWIYCLLVNTPDGLSADDMSIIRTLTRSCIRLRSNLTGEVDLDAVSNLNAIITIVGLYFRQTDLLQ